MHTDSPAMSTPLPLCQYLHVGAVVERTGAHKVAQRTHERLRVIVGPHVGTQCGLVAEGLGAELACVGSDLAVLDHVLLQCLTGLGHHGAE